jgi:hypothetical protein
MRNSALFWYTKNGFNIGDFCFYRGMNRQYKKNTYASNGRPPQLSLHFARPFLFNGLS